MHLSSSTTCIPNFIEIEETFCGRTGVWTEISRPNNCIVKMSRHARGLHGRTDGQGLGGKHGWQAVSADRLQAGTDGSGGGRQAKIAMSRQGRGLRGWTDGRTGTSNPAAWWLAIFKAILTPLCIILIHSDASAWPNILYSAALNNSHEVIKKLVNSSILLTILIAKTLPVCLFRARRTVANCPCPSWSPIA